MLTYIARCLWQMLFCDCLYANSNGNMNLYVNHIFQWQNQCKQSFVCIAVYERSPLCRKNICRLRILAANIYSYYSCFCQYQNQKLFQVFQGQRTLVPICYGWSGIQYIFVYRNVKRVIRIFKNELIPSVFLKKFGFIIKFYAIPVLGRNSVYGLFTFL